MEIAKKHDSKVCTFEAKLGKTHIQAISSVEDEKKIQRS